MARGFLRFLSLTAFQAEGCGGGFAASFIKKGRGWRRRLGRRVVKGKVDGPPGRRLWPPKGGRLCPHRGNDSLHFVRRSAQGATAPAALRVVVSPLRAMNIKSALRDWLSASYGMINILRIGSLRSPPPFRLRRTSPASGGQNKALKSSPFISSSQHNGAL